MLKFNLKRIMDDNGITIQELHERTGISRNAISLLYNNKSKGIQLDTLDKITKALGLYSFEDIFEEYSEYDIKNLSFSIEYDKNFLNYYEEALGILRVLEGDNILCELPILYGGDDNFSIFNINREALTFFESNSSFDFYRAENKIDTLFKENKTDLELFLIKVFKKIVEDKGINSKWFIVKSDIGYFDKNQYTAFSFCWDRELLFSHEENLKAYVKAKYTTFL